MKKFFKNKIVRFALGVIIAVALALGFTILQAYISLKRNEQVSPYWITLVNKQDYYYTEEEMRYMAKVNKYLTPLNPFVTEQGEYKRLKKNNDEQEKEIDFKNVDYQQRMNSWAAELQTKRPRNMKKGHIWIPGSNLSLALPQDWKEVFDPYKEPYFPITEVEANSTVLQATDNSHAFMRIQAQELSGDLKNTVTNIEKGLSFFDIAKHDRTDVHFSNEFDTQIAAGFENVYDTSGLGEGWNTPTYDIKYVPVTINGQQLYVCRLVNQFADGDVVYITYYSQAGLYLITTKAMYKVEDEASIKPMIERTITNFNTFTLDYLDKDEPKYHGITKQEEKEKQNK